MTRSLDATQSAGKRGRRVWHRFRWPLIVSLSLLGCPAVWAERVPGLEVILEAQGRLTMPQRGSRWIDGTVRNGSDRTISGLVLTTSADQLSTWTVEVAPRTIASLAPMQTAPFRLQVTAPRTIFRQTLYIRVDVSTAGFSGNSDSFVAVLDPWRVWASVGAVLAAGAAALFILIYRRVSRS